MTARTGRSRVRAVGGVVRLTLRESLRDPGSWGILAVFVLLLLLYPAFTFFSFGEEDRLIREMGLQTLRLYALGLACLHAVRVLPRDREEGVRDVLLSRPLGSLGYLGGRLLGLVAVWALAGLVLAGVLTLLLWQGGGGVGSVADYGLALAGVFLEGTVLVALAVTLSTGLRPVPASVLTALLFVGGHLLPAVLPGLPDPVARGLPVLVPALDAYALETAVGAGRSVSVGEVARIGGLTVLYLGLYLSLGSFLVERGEA